MSTRTTASFVAALLLAPLASLAVDETPAPDLAQSEATAEATPQPDDGPTALKVGRDPETGELRRPTAAENAELTRQLRAFWAQHPRHVAKTDPRTGATSLVVAPHSINTSIATIGPDGNLVWTCVEDSADIEATFELLRAHAAKQRLGRGER